MQASCTRGTTSVTRPGKARPVAAVDSRGNVCGAEGPRTDHGGVADMSFIAWSCLSQGARGAVKKFRLPLDSDPVGTQCPVSGLGFRLWTRGSASLPLIFSQRQGLGAKRPCRALSRFIVATVRCQPPASNPTNSSTSGTLISNEGTFPE